MQNAFVESFNGRRRDEFLNETLFTSLMQARLALEDWRRDYNTASFAARLAGSGRLCRKLLTATRPRCCAR
jgi:putative transposase